MNRLFDFNHPFFKPLWIRLLVTGSCFVWGSVEFITGAPLWGILFCGLGALAAYGLFVTFDPRTAEHRQLDDQSGE
ncbi:DUF3329 domain-containing protein [Pseudohoeflea suaedae]|uniref:DUF3329 domain-containing protein n=1 Tax=Pseudohoeflea suaedae TaxID=877384 RepID=A0A4R5PI87_9HYPH|nr:DUF3329 domain-containing protein [Pseudohoeflea suaedae]TDH34946.1 DUF3329 domain-containing protein [Pseudohoeflea suaedae]